MTRPDVRTYGNWRKPTSPGIFGIGLAGTLLLFGGALLVIGALFVSIVLALGLTVLVALMLAPLLIRDQHGRNGLQWLTATGSWMLGVMQGRHLYRSGPFGRTPASTSRLPGLAAPLEVSEAVDGHGRPFAILTAPGPWHHTVVLDCHADGASLVDAEQVDTWVAYWGDWLAQLGHEPGLVAASVTIEAAPDTGERLVREVSGNVHAEAPQLAREVLAEIVRDYPLGSATLTSRVALTYSGAARNTGARRSLAAVAQMLGTRLPGLAADLQMTGAGPALPMTARELGVMMRVAYDPAAAGLAEGVPDDGVLWDEVGPVGTMETPDAYRHDSAWSMTWAMSEAPRGEVFSSVLNRLVMPHPDILRKRVTLVYRPHDVGASARLVERDRKDALFKAKQAKIAQARDSIAVQAADRAAQEEATGAGLVRFSLYVTATVADAEDLNLAASAVDNLAAASRLQLRRVRFAQASAFLAALPLGLVMPLHLKVPQAVRDAM
ncbi:MAG TPA: SCO6880 family protein [Yinghuangia sp.]|uniref:SCO6880 family protein n=1 Tax=Yinghuangia sp. YIM S10712 TaxID=3436930 RepID=UPI002BBF9DB2|nr:SCO6880 family protein [Yinghuangia sp.]